MATKAVKAEATAPAPSPEVMASILGMLGISAEQLQQLQRSNGSAVEVEAEVSITFHPRKEKASTSGGTLRFDETEDGKFTDATLAGSFYARKALQRRLGLSAKDSIVVTIRKA